jgi:hypothetical protein
MNRITSLSMEKSREKWSLKSDLDELFRDHFFIDKFHAISR